MDIWKVIPPVLSDIFPTIYMLFVQDCSQTGYNKHMADYCFQIHMQIYFFLFYKIKKRMCISLCCRPHYDCCEIWSHKKVIIMGPNLMQINMTGCKVIVYYNCCFVDLLYLCLTKTLCSCIMQTTCWKNLVTNFYKSNKTLKKKKNFGDIKLKNIFTYISLHSQIVRSEKWYEQLLKGMCYI